MKKIMLDIGHGGKDSGATANGLVEKQLNLAVGFLARDELSKYDVEVRMTREKDMDLGDDERVNIVKSYNPNLCISIHHNAAGPAARGAEVIHAHYDSYDDALASDILHRLSQAGMPARRAFAKLNSKGSDWYYMIRRIWDNDTQATITEGGFLTNIQDAQLLKNNEFLQKEAQAIAGAAAAHLKLEQKNAQHWGDEYIKRMQQLGLISGDHSPTSNVTWAELAVVTVRITDKLEKGLHSNVE